MTCYFSGVAYCNLVCGLLLLVAVTLTARHVYLGSREEFTVILVAFAFGFAISNIFASFVTMGCSSNQEVYWTERFIYYLLYLQSWLIAMKYLHAALVSQAKPTFDPNLVKPLKWIGIGVFSFTMIVIYLWEVIGFPGWH